MTKSSSKFKKILWILLTIFLIAYVITNIVRSFLLSGIDQNNHQPLDGLISDASIKILEESCFDCHSVKYKRYFYDTLPVINIVIARHISEGLEEANFSTVANKGTKELADLLDESIETIEEKEMPLSEYLIIHPAAKITPDELMQLKDDLYALEGAKTTNDGEEYDAQMNQQDGDDYGDEDNADDNADNDEDYSDDDEDDDYDDEDDDDYDDEDDDDDDK